MSHHAQAANAVAAGQPILEQEYPQPFRNETRIFSYQNWQQELKDLQKDVEQEEEQQRPRLRSQLLPTFHSPALALVHPPFHHRTLPPPFAIPPWTPPWLFQSPPQVEADTSHTHRPGLVPGVDPTPPIIPHPDLSNPPHPPFPIGESLTTPHPPWGPPRSNAEAASRRLRNLRRHLRDRFHILNAELQNLERRRVEMERDVREYVEGFEGLDEGDWERREEELEAGFEERERRLAEGNEEMKALRAEERALRRERLEKMKTEWD